MSLRERCCDLYRRILREGTSHQGDPVDTLVSFVVSEIGRSADARLDASLPLCLYFATQEDRAEFIELVREAKPDMVALKLP